MAPFGSPFGMLCGVPGNLENGTRTLTGVRFPHLDLIFSGPISRPEFAADFFQYFCTFRYFGTPFGRPFDSLWLGNGGLEKSSKTERKQLQRRIPVDLSWGRLPLKKRISDPLLPKRLAEFGIGLNTPCVPWRHGGG